MAVTTRYFQPAAATWVTGTAYVVGDYVLGTDNKNWRCITGHTSAAADRPITGANYATYWEECDGTTWDKRAALVAGSAWSAVITAFNFSTGSDSLYCLIEGNKTYNAGSVSLVTGSFSSGAPTVARQLTLHGCDSSGVPLSDPDGNWTSDQPAFDTTTFPTLSYTGNVLSVDLNSATTTLRFIKLAGTGNTTNPFVRSVTLINCFVTNSASNTSLVVSGALTAFNSVFEATGTAYAIVTQSGSLVNCRIVGNSSASSGNRHGISSATASSFYLRVTVVNNPGSGLILTSSTTSSSSSMINCLFHGNGYGIRLQSVAGQTSLQRIQGCYIANSTTAGIDGQSQAYPITFSSRLRDNGTSGNWTAILGNSLTNENDNINYTTDSDDASELVNVAGGDYRIKNTATIWGKGFGVSEEPPASSAGGSFAFIG
jgi:hypothetical protein